MCMMAPPPMNYTPPKRPPKEAGPESPDDMVNNQIVENANDRSLQDARRNSNRGPTASGQKGSQSGSKTNKAY